MTIQIEVTMESQSVVEHKDKQSQDKRCYPTSVSLTQSHKDKLAALGGSKWLREQIEKAAPNDQD